MQLLFTSRLNKKVLALCALIGTMVSVSNHTARAQGYCIPVYTSPCSSADFINKFSFNTLNKLNSGCNGNANNYIHDLSVTTSVEKGGAYPLSVQSGSTYAQSFAVWIDYNNDGDFADANEFAYDSPIDSKDAFTAYISIPTNITPGQRRLRVRSKYGAKFMSTDFCSTFGYGETEDYTITIAQPAACVDPPVAGTAVASKSVLCDPNTPFYLTLTGSPNGTGQTYQWQRSSNGNTWTDIFGATTKAITQTITQSTHFRCLVTCSGTSISSPVFVSIAAPFSLNFTASDVSCYGLNDGSVTALLTGGTSPYTYVWSVGGSPTGPPQTYPNAPTIDSVYANSFNVKITDANGCTITGSYWLNQPGSLYLQKDTGSSSCLSPTGWASVTVFGGTLPYSYLWQGGQTKDSITSLSAGIYQVTVTDGNNCTASTSIAISDAGGPALTFTATPVSCHGDNDGWASVTATGGTPPFSYSWNTTPQQTTASVTGLTGGNHFVTVSNASGCKYVGTAYVSEPNPLYSAASTNSVTCSSCNGSLYTSVQGGNWPYTYSWSNGSTAYFIDSLCAGNYTLTITDAKGCVLNETHPVLKPAPITASTTQKDISCFGADDGCLAITPSGGTPPYSYNWSPFNFTGDTASPLSPGTYSVIVTDSDTCGAADTVSVIISQPAVLTASFTTTAAACHGTCTGTATVIPSGGTGPYSYVWTAGDQATQTATALCAGDQIVLITDTNNCILWDTVVVAEPFPVPVTVTTTPTSCTTQSGTAVASVTGPNAFPPFSYLWTTGSTTNSATGLDAGIYRANVTDGNGCFGFADAMITSSNGPVIATVSVTPVSCFGLSNGAIDISVSGGGAPYTYLWSNGQTTQDASNLSYGPYEVKVMSSTGCLAVKSIFVSEPAKLSFASTVINSGCSATNGSAAVAVSGGVSPYTYLWSSGGTTSAKSSIGAGLYEVEVTDSKGCMDSTLLAVQDSGGPAVSVDTVAPVNCGGKGFILLAPQDSATISSFLWSTGSTTQNLTNAAPGNYGVTVTDTSGCKSILIAPVDPVLPLLKPLCLVTVDTLTHQNIVVWEKPVSAFIAGFNIYRESSQQGIYQKIAYSPYANVSTYYDPIADPDSKWGRYRISMVDVCGTEGPVSADHKTIHLSIHAADANSTTLIWDSYVGYPFSYYNIFRKDSLNGIWTLIAAMPANFNTYTDATFPLTGDTIYYHVDVDHPGGDCMATIKNPNPMATTVKSGKSNSSERVTDPPASVAEMTAENRVLIYPNPNNGLFTLELKNISFSGMKIFNALGEELKNTDMKFGKNKIDVDMHHLPAGFYYVQVSSDQTVITKKFIIK